MKTEHHTPAPVMGPVATLERPIEVNEVTRTVAACRPAATPADRPHILARRNARWARRAAHG